MNILPFKKDFPFLFTNNQVCLPICQQRLLVFSMKTILLNSSNQKNWKGTLVIKLQYSTWLFSMSSVCFHAQFRICLFSQKKKRKEKRNKYSFRFYKIGTSGQCFSQILPAWHAIEMVETCSFSYAPLKFCTMTPNFDPVFSQYSINCSCSDVGFSKLAPVLYTVGL